MGLLYCNAFKEFRQQVVNLTEERRVFTLFLSKILSMMRDHSVIALPATRKLIDTLNGSVVAPMFSAANTTPRSIKNTRVAHFFMFYQLICWLKF